MFFTQLILVRRSPLPLKNIFFSSVQGFWRVLSLGDFPLTLSFVVYGHFSSGFLAAGPLFFPPRTFSFLFPMRVLIGLLACFLAKHTCGCCL